MIRTSVTFNAVTVGTPLHSWAVEWGRGLSGESRVEMQSMCVGPRGAEGGGALQRRDPVLLPSGPGAWSCPGLKQALSRHFLGRCMDTAGAAAACLLTVTWRQSQAG